MHREAIVTLSTSRKSSGKGNPFRQLGITACLFRSTSYDRYNRQSILKFCISYLVCIFSVTILSAALDPNIFDGRITEHSPNSTAGSLELRGAEFEDSGSKGGSTGIDITEGDEKRDLESLGDSGGGELLESYSSKVSTTSSSPGSISGSTERATSDSRESNMGGGTYGEVTSKDKPNSLGGVSGGNSSTEASGEPSGDSSFVSQEPRNFEDFSFGGAGLHETVEINRSKESTILSLPPSGVNLRQLGTYTVKLEPCTRQKSPLITDLAILSGF